MTQEMTPIKYIEWYSPGQKMMRCQGCGALLVDGDTEQHSGWHKALFDLFVTLGDL